MTVDKKPVVILVAEDDDDDYRLTYDAFQECHLLNDLHRVKDGEEMMDYLYHRHAFEAAKSSPPPVLILLDLNMPKKDGRECLQEIKADPSLKQIPIVILTTSKAEEDVLRSYSQGCELLCQEAGHLCRAGRSRLRARTLLVRDRGNPRA